MKSKKGMDGSLWVIVTIIIVILFLVFNTTIFGKIVGTVHNTFVKPCLQDFGGVCRTNCLTTEYSYSYTCVGADGEKLGEGVCCAKPAAVQAYEDKISNENSANTADSNNKKTKDANNNKQNSDSEASSSSSTNSAAKTANSRNSYSTRTLEIRLGDSLTKIHGSSTQTIKNGSTYEFHIWGDGPGYMYCSAYVTNAGVGSDNKKTNVQGLTVKLNRQSCKGETNKKTLTLEPNSNKLPKDFNLNVLLLNSSYGIIQSSVVPLHLVK